MSRDDLTTGVRERAGGRGGRPPWRRVLSEGPSNTVSSERRPEGQGRVLLVPATKASRPPAGTLWAPTERGAARAPPAGAAVSRARVSCGLLRPCHQPSSHPQPQRVLGGSSSGRGGVGSAGRPPRALPQADEEAKPGPGSRARHTSCVCCGPNPPRGPCRAPRTPESSPAGPRLLRVLLPTHRGARRVGCSALTGPSPPASQPGARRDVRPAVSKVTATCGAEASPESD